MPVGKRSVHPHLLMLSQTMKILTGLELNAMILEAIIEEQIYRLNVPESLLAQAGDFFDQLDRDMDQGWQMSRDWVAQPDQIQRAQIVADKLLTALENQNEKLGMLMAGYLVTRLPGLKSVEPDIRGEIQNTVFDFHSESAGEATGLNASAASARPAQAPRAPAEAAELATDGADIEKIAATAGEGAPRGLSKLQAMTQAGQDVSKVFKVGKGYRFSVFDHATQSWQDSPLLKTQAEADRLREQVFTARYEALQQKT
jgi:hypothetical protein